MRARAGAGWLVKLLRTLRRVRRANYKTARVLGDVTALLSGDPKRITKRVVNKTIGRATGRLYRK